MKWFKHDSDANTDAKLKKLRHKYGITGYGLYWYCIELIAGSVSPKNITFELEEDAEIIALEWRLDQLKVQEMMCYMAEINLFDITENNRIRCLKLARRLDDTNAKNPQIKAIIDGMDSDLLGVSPNNSDKVRPDKTRLEYKNNSYPAGMDESLLASISKQWNEQMTTQPTVDLTKQTQINKKRWAKIKKILVDFPDYKDHEYWEGYIYQLAHLPDFEWQRNNKQLTFDQAVQLEKFDRNRGLMKMGVS